MKQCIECGTFSSDDTMFCSVCGKRFPDATDVLAAESSKQKYKDEHGLDGIQKLANTTHPEIIPLLQRVALFLEDGEFDRADEYCERVLDIEPTNADAYIGKLLVEFRCTMREQLKYCRETIADSKNYAKVLRFGDDKQKYFVVDAEKAIQADIARITEEATAKRTQEESVTEEEIPEPDQQETEFDETEEYYIDIACPYCHEELSYTNWQIKEGELICPMCDGQFVFDEGMRI